MGLQGFYVIDFPSTLSSTIWVFYVELDRSFRNCGLLTHELYTFRIKFHEELEWETAAI